MNFNKAFSTLLEGHTSKSTTSAAVLLIAKKLANLVIPFFPLVLAAFPGYVQMSRPDALF